jgi:hypothetical protein
MTSQVVVWTPELDRLLLDLRAKGKSWKVIIAALMIRQTACEGRLKALKRAGGVAAVKVAEAETDEGVAHAPAGVDGLEWLVKKGRLTNEQMGQAWAYRRDFRAAEGEGAGMKSSLAALDAVKGGRGDVLPVVYSQAMAKRRQFIRRYQILGGEDHVLIVLDAVCGRGMTTRELAGGDGHRASTHEAVLRVALNMLATHAKLIS